MYEFPDDCVFEELQQHFETCCQTAEGDAWNDANKSFVLEFFVQGTILVLYFGRTAVIWFETDA